MPRQNKPELLSPAGDRERLEAAVKYGADAVYLAGKSLGMRTAPQNFDEQGLAEAVGYCHARGVKVYQTVNIIPHNSDLEKAPAIFAQAKKAEVDGLIISDLSLIELAKKYAPDTEIHISTQTGVTNYGSANVLYEMGAKRVVLARELSLEEIAEIRAKTPKELDIECFVHGAMCVSFSGRCLLSNYLAGRDSNRGDCAQPCRWKYALMEETRPGQYFPVEEDGGTYIMNARDMCMIEHIPDMVKAGICSFKIEGRAKSAYYTAVVTNAYRAAIDGFCADGSDGYKPEKWIVDETRKVSHREYCTGFYYSDPRDDAQIYYEGGYKRQWRVVAVTEKYEGGRLWVTQRNRFFEGDEVEIMSPGQEPVKVTVTDLRDGTDAPITNAPHPMMEASFLCDRPCPPGAYVRCEEKPE